MLLFVLKLVFVYFCILYTLYSIQYTRATQEIAPHVVNIILQKKELVKFANFMQVGFLRESGEVGWLTQKKDLTTYIYIYSHFPLPRTNQYNW